MQGWCKSHRRDPVVGIYLPAGSTQPQRDFAMRSQVYFAWVGEAKSPLDLAAADTAIGAMITTDAFDFFTTVYTQHDLYQLRLSGPRSLWKFASYIQAQKNTLACW